MIKVHVRGFRGVEVADIECAPIALLTGTVGAGKSSIIQPIAATLTGQTSTAAAAARLVRRGDKAAYCVVTGENGAAMMKWPGELETKGADPPRATPYAAGLESISRMKPESRAAALEPYLRAAPQKEDLEREMQEEFTAEKIDALWGEIQRYGWDTTTSNLERRRGDARAAWTAVTKTNFGSDKSATWRPQGWRPEYENSDPKKLAESLLQARVAHEAAVAAAAVGKIQVEGLREAAGQEDQRRTAFADAEVAVQQAEAALKNAEDHRAALPRPDRTNGIKCPHCAGLITIDLSGYATPFVPMPPAEIKARANAIAAADGIVENNKSAVWNARTALTAAETALRASEAAATQLAAASQPVTEQHDVEAARAAVAGWENIIGMVNIVTSADGHYRAWKEAQTLMSIVGPNGLRRQKQTKAIEVYNDTILARLCDLAEWPRVVIDAKDLSIVYHDTAYDLCSRGEQFQTRAVLQVAQAMSDGSAMLLFDDLPDIGTDRRTRWGLLKLIGEANIPAVLALASLETIPDLAGAGWGRTYVIDGGKVTPFDAEQEAAE